MMVGEEQVAFPAVPELLSPSHGCLLYTSPSPRDS